MGENLPMKTLCLKISNLFKTIKEKNIKSRTSIMDDGSTVVRPFSFGLLYAAILIFITAFFWDMIIGEFFRRFGYNTFINRLPNFLTILEKMFIDINWSYIDKVYDPLIATIQISIVGTIVGAILAIPFSFLASQNIMGKSRIPILTKFMLSIIRTFPTLVYALILSFIFGYGTFIGVLATVIFTFGIISKMMYEIIETVDLSSFVAIEATGASKIMAFRTAVVPQIIGRFYSVTLYNFEINLRASAILGLVGAGGIGSILNDQMSLRNYGNTSVILLVLLAVVIAVENLSRYLRGRLS
jgi:phosphonate transport system permease protein